MTVEYQPWLQWPVRVGHWRELAAGTFRTSMEQVRAGEVAHAAQLVAVALEEASELRDVYDRWPKAAQRWMLESGAERSFINLELGPLADVLGTTGNEIPADWSRYAEATERAIEACARRLITTAVEAIEETLETWLVAQDAAVDWASGVIDIAVRLIGESRLGDPWSVLMADWIETHAARYDLPHQDWSESVTQLALSIFHGIHALLSGTARQGDIELIHEADRIGFRFAPCGSGGRSVDSQITGRRPRSAAPFGFAVTNQHHDWAWNKVGICSYCVHCCVLNEVSPTDLLGFPTRVIDAPRWPSTDVPTSCTWWIYRDTTLIPDRVYSRIRRSPGRTPPSSGSADNDANGDWRRSCTIKGGNHE